MKRNNNNRVAAKVLVLLALCATLFSFSAYRGRDSFAIFLNDKLLLEQFVMPKEGVRTFELTRANYNDQLSIYYTHCGQPGKGRTIAIKDENNHTLKEWHFGDASHLKSSMSCKVGDILSLQKNNQGKLQLWYATKEFPAGHVLASIVVGSGGKATSR